MSFDREKEFEQNMNQLVALLKKIIKNLPMPGNSSQPFSTPIPNQGGSEGGGININFCFFNFMPLSEDEMSALEDAYEEALDQQDEKVSENGIKLNSEDLDFLKKNGISF